LSTLVNPIHTKTTHPIHLSIQDIRNLSHITTDFATWFTTVMKTYQVPGHLLKMKTVSQQSELFLAKVVSLSQNTTLSSSQNEREWDPKKSAQMRQNTISFRRIRQVERSYEHPEEQILAIQRLFGCGKHC